MLTTTCMPAHAPDICMQTAILHLHAKSSCHRDLVSDDGGPSTSTWTAASYRLPDWCCATCRHARAHLRSRQLALRGRRTCNPYAQACKRRILTTDEVPIRSCILCWMVFFASTRFACWASGARHAVSSYLRRCNDTSSASQALLLDHTGMPSAAANDLPGRGGSQQAPVSYKQPSTAPGCPNTRTCTCAAHIAPHRCWLA